MSSVFFYWFMCWLLMKLIIRVKVKSIMMLMLMLLVLRFIWIG